MTEVVTDTSPAALEAAAEANFLGFWRILFESPLIEVREDPDITTYTTGIPFPLFNGVMRTDLRGETMDERITEVMERFRSTKLPMMWVVSPSSAPADIGRRLEGNGLVLEEAPNPGMAIDLRNLSDDPGGPSRLSLSTVDGMDSLRIWSDVLTRGFEMPEFVGKAFLDMFESLGGPGPDQPWRAYLGSIDGEPIATAMLALAAGVAGIFNVATLPEARGKGAGTAITAAALRDAVRMGYRVGVLQASAMGRSVYHRMGFREYGAYSQYIWMPG